MNISASNILFTFGVVLIILGVLCYLSFWLIVYGFVFLPIGAFLILLSRKKIFVKLLTISIPFLFVGGSIVASFAKPETFLIPEEFRGTVYVVFNEKKGQPKDFEGRRRVYRIPSSGVLFTQFDKNEGILDQEFYFVSKNGKRRHAGILDVRDFNEEWTINKNKKEPPRDSLAVFNPGTMGSTASTNNKEKIVFTSLMVGRYSDVKSLDYLDDEYIDSLRKKNGL